MALVSGISFTIGASRIVSLFYLGNLSDRQGRRLVSSIGLTSLGVFAFLITLVSNPVILLAASVLNGVTTAAFGTIAAFITDNSEPKDIDRRMSFNMVSQGAGFAIGPIIGGFVAEDYGFHAGYYLASALALAALVSAVYGMRGGMKSPPAKRGMFSSGREALSSPTVLSLCVLSVLSAFAFGCVYTFLPLRGQMVGLGDAEIGTILGVRTAMSAVARLPMGYLSSRLGKTGLISLGIVLPAIAGLLIPLTPSFLFLTLIVCTEGTGYGIFMTSSRSMMAVASEEHLRGMSMALLDIFGSMGYGFLVLAVGFGASFFGLSFAFIAMSLTLLIGGIAPLRMLRKAIEESLSSGG